MNTIEPQPEPTSTKPFMFHGTAKEYFGIWIVNVLLTIITLGIYSAWAKVRRQRYFYGNAELDGHGFEYLATPKQILIGRIIVFAILIGYNLVANFFPIASLFLFVLFLIALPELFRRGMRFNARVTSYRNVRFDFEGIAGICV